MDENDPYVIAFKVFVHCLPINDYVINVMMNTITYYCGHNNTFTIPHSYVDSIIDKSK